MAENAEQQHQSQSESGTVSGKVGASQFIIKVPKDQIYKIPPPQNAKLYADYTNRKPNRISLCCRCILWTIALVLAATLVLTIVASVSYLIYRPQIPRYTIEKVSVSGFDSNLTRSTSGSSIRLKFTIAVRAENPNEKVSIYYDKISSVTIRYLETELCEGEMPYFKQPKRNVTVLWMDLRGAEIVSGGTVYDALVRDVKAGRVPLVVNVEAPMRIGIRNVKSLKVRVLIACEVAVDELTEAARIVSGGCGSRIKIW